MRSFLRNAGTPICVLGKTNFWCGSRFQQSSGWFLRATIFFLTTGATSAGRKTPGSEFLATTGLLPPSGRPFWKPMSYSWLLEFSLRFAFDRYSFQIECGMFLSFWSIEWIAPILFPSRGWGILVWTGFVFLLEPINFRWGWPSLIENFYRVACSSFWP